MASTIRHIFGNTYGFGIDDDDGCFRYDTRPFCQKVLNCTSGVSDQCAFEFHGSLCGSDLVCAGGFDTQVATDACWCTGSCGSEPPYMGWTWAAPGQLNHIVGMATPIGQPTILTANKRYKVTFTVIRVTSPFVEIEGSVTVSCGTNSGTTVTASGTYVQYINSSNTAFAITPSIDFDGAIDNVSIYELTTQYMVYLTDSNGDIVGTPNAATLLDGDIFKYDRLFCAFEAPDGCYNICVASACDVGSFDDLVTNGAFSTSASWTYGFTGGFGWSYTPNRACHSVGSGAHDLTQVLTNSKAGLNYFFSFAITNYVAGTVTICIGGTCMPAVSGNGTYSGNIVCPTDGATLKFTASAAFNGCVDDISFTLDTTSYPTDSCSQCINLTSVWPCTVNLTWTNEENAFGFDYESTAFTQGIRVPAYLDFPKYSEEQQRFKNSVGTEEILVFYGDKKKELKIDFMPEYMHDALSIGKGHDHFYIDGVEYICDEGYEPIMNKARRLKLWLVDLLVRKKTVFEKNSKG